MSDESIGALWIKKSKKGDAYFSIKINDEFYVAFSNKYKKADNQPDYRIFKQDEPKPTKQDYNQDEEIPF